MLLGSCAVVRTYLGIGAKIVFRGCFPAVWASGKIYAFGFRLPLLPVPSGRIFILSEIFGASYVILATIAKFGGFSLAEGCVCIVPM